MGLFDDLGNLWNDVEHAGSVVFHSMEDVLSHLDTLGVPFFPSLPQFVQFIMSIGENPFTFLPRLVGIASGRGANPVQALEELAQGLLTEGPQAFAQKQVKRVTDPMIQQVQAHTQVSQSVGALHQNTITQVQQKLTALRTGNNGSLGLQGDFATALDTHFQVVQTSVNVLTAPLNPGGSAGDDPPMQHYKQAQAAIDQAFIFALEGIAVIAIGLAIVDIIILVLEIIVAALGAVITVEVAGAGGLLIGGGEAVIDVGLIAAELSFIGELILADAAIWAAATLIALAVYGIEELIYQHQHASSVAVPAYPDWVLPDGSRLAKEFEQKAERIWDEFKKLVKQGLTAGIVAYLACHYSIKQMEQILDNWNLFGSVLEDLTSGDINVRIEAEALVHAIMMIGPTNIAQYGVKYTWRDANGNPILQPNGKPKTGDIDIVTKYQPPWLIEVGQANKISKKDFPAQLRALKQEAALRKPPARAMFYVQTPADPITPNQQKQLDETVALAKSILGANNVVVMPPLNC